MLSSMNMNASRQRSDGVIMIGSAMADCPMKAIIMIGKDVLKMGGTSRQ